MRERRTLTLIGSWIGLLVAVGLLIVLFGFMGATSTGSTLASMVFVIGATVAAIAFVLSDVHGDRHHRHHH